MINIPSNDWQEYAKLGAEYIDIADIIPERYKWLDIDYEDYLKGQLTLNNQQKAWQYFGYQQSLLVLIAPQTYSYQGSWNAPYLVVGLLAKDGGITMLPQYPLPHSLNYWLEPYSNFSFAIPRELCEQALVMHPAVWLGQQTSVAWPEFVAYCTYWWQTCLDKCAVLPIDMQANSQVKITGLYHIIQARKIAPIADKLCTAVSQTYADSDNYAAANTTYPQQIWLAYDKGLNIHKDINNLAKKICAQEQEFVISLTAQSASGKTTLMQHIWQQQWSLAVCLDMPVPLWGKWGHQGVELITLEDVFEDLPKCSEANTTKSLQAIEKLIGLRSDNIEKAITQLSTAIKLKYQDFAQGWHAWLAYHQLYTYQERKYARLGGLHLALQQSYDECDSLQQRIDFFGYKLQEWRQIYKRLFAWGKKKYLAKQFKYLFPEVVILGWSLQRMDAYIRAYYYKLEQKLLDIEDIIKGMRNEQLQLSRLANQAQIWYNNFVSKDAQGLPQSLSWQDQANIDISFRQELSILVKWYWLLRQQKSCWSEEEPQEIEYLWIEHADKVALHQLPCLQNIKQIILMAEVAGHSEPRCSPWLEDNLAKTMNLDIVEGLSFATGSIWQLCNPYLPQLHLATCFFQQPAIVAAKAALLQTSFCVAEMHSDTLQPLPDLPTWLLCFADGDTYITKVIQWLNKYHNIIVQWSDNWANKITLVASTKTHANQLAIACKDYFALEFYAVALEELDKISISPIVIFVNGFTADYPYTVNFEAGNYLLAKLLDKCWGHLWVVTDKCYFNKQNNSPSGRLAKIMQDCDKSKVVVGEDYARVT